MNMVDLIKDLVFPPGLYCNCCGKFTDASRTYGLCDHCIERMRFGMKEIKWGKSEDFDAAAYAMEYGLYERRLIFSLKYDRRTYMSSVIANILFDAMREFLVKNGRCPWFASDMIVPVPISKKRLKSRGFNQTEKIGRHLSIMTGIRMNNHCLMRAKDTTAQRSLSPMEREKNMSGAFVVPEKSCGQINGKSILLLDDIYTTGATAAACCRSLRAAGAEKIYFLSLLAVVPDDKIKEAAQVCG